MEDEQSMRNYLCEGDLISAEVHSVFADGSLSLHMRSLKYGKVKNYIINITYFIPFSQYYYQI